MRDVIQPTLFVALFLLAPIAAASSPAKVFLSTQEALELVYPECEVERETVYLTKEQRKSATKLAGFEIETGLAYVYAAYRKGELVGYAYFDTHEVRTKRETIMIAVTPDARVRRLEVLAFAEPLEYLPSSKWYAQFMGKRLDEKLKVKGNIRSVTGATLTARATTAAVRRALAIHGVVHPAPSSTAGAPSGA